MTFNDISIGFQNRKPRYRLKENASSTSQLTEAKEGLQVPGKASELGKEFRNDAGRRAVSWVASPQDDGPGNFLISCEDSSGVGDQIPETGDSLGYNGSSGTEGGIITGWSERVNSSI
jgi:hypothetical protein